VLTLDCQATAERAISFGFPRERICIFPWGVDLNLFSPQSCVAAGKAWRQQQGWNEAIVLLCLRAWEPNYGVDVLARAFVQAAQQNPALRLILLNEGSEAAKIRSVLRAAGVEDRIYFGGRIPNADLTTYFGAADLYISPAHVDGTSVSLLEALACGLPAIVSDIPANLEWVREGENGWIFPDEDDQALAQVILTAAALDWRPMSLQARQDAVERADWSKNFQMLLKCYQDTVDYGKASKA
jgi:glycosyltransferase involved in cell wall biosynthesis